MKEIPKFCKTCEITNRVIEQVDCFREGVTMEIRIITIANKSGLHSRPASKFILAAKKFESSIAIRRFESNEAPVNGKSMARVLSLGISGGETIEIKAEGRDESKAIMTLIELIEAGLGE
jgi:phosphocarrier protein